MIDRAVRACFGEAVLAGLDIEFARIESTMEGDPIATVYSFEPPGSFVMLHDSTQDSFGSGGWTVTVCNRIVNDPNEVFRFDGCGEGEILR